MEASLTELRRATGKLLSAVLNRKQSVTLTQHGKTVAEISPRTSAMSGADFVRLWKSRSKLDRATAETVAKNMAEIKNAE